MMVKEVEIRDRGAFDYDEQYLEQHGMLHDITEKKVISSILNASSNDVVLDAGCGTGRFVFELAGNCNMVYAMDYSGNSIEVLCRKLLAGDVRNVVPFVGDICQPIGMEKFDKVVSVQVIQHIETPMLALKNLYDSLKVGGVCVVTVYNESPFYLGLLFGRKLQKEGVFSNGIPYWRYSADELERMFKKCGFRDVSVRGCVNVSWYRRAGNIFYPLTKLDAFLSRYSISKRLGVYLVAKGAK